MYHIPSKFEMIRTPKRAIHLFRKFRWRGQKACPHCGCIEHITTHSLLASGLKRYRCQDCSQTFSDTTGTIFARSKIPLWKWMYVLLVLFESTGSLSSAEVARNIEVSYKTAFAMMKKVRGSLFLKRFAGMLQGTIESDEAWVSHTSNQQILLGMVERNGSVKIFPICDRASDQIYAPHLWYVRPESTIYSDGHTAYKTLVGRFFHASVNHSRSEFSRGKIHTNTIEGVWSMLKGILRTIHHGVSKKYLLSYCDLFSFMYSHRHLSFSHKFSLLFYSLCQPRSCTY